MDKERREDLRQDLEENGVYTLEHVTPRELRALLDLADERDRYRKELEWVRNDNVYLGYTQPETLEGIDAAL